jgi:hypothetical protein
MKLSKKGEYALRALIDLGIAAEVGRDLLRVGEIAEKEKIPAKFLEQVMQDLRGGGFHPERSAASLEAIAWRARPRRSRWGRWCG